MTASPHRPAPAALRGGGRVPRSPRRALDAVIWDYDGTLADTRATDEAAVAALVVRDPSAAAGVQRFWETEGLPILERLEMAWPGHARDIAGLFDFDGDTVPRVHPGIRRTLAALRRRGMALAVVSSRRVEPLRRGLDACRLAAFFSSVVGLESVRASKPDPEGLLMALRALEVTPARAVYVGDREIDMEAARRAGMTGWKATWGGPEQGTAAPLGLRRPEEVLDRIEEPTAAAG